MFAQSVLWIVILIFTHSPSYHQAFNSAVVTCWGSNLKIGDSILALCVFVYYYYFYQFNRGVRGETAVISRFY